MPGLEPIPDLLPMMPRLCADAADVPADAAAADTAAEEEEVAAVAAEAAAEAEAEDAPAASEIGEQPEDFGGSFANDADIASFVGDEMPSGCYDEEVTCREPPPPPFHFTQHSPLHTHTHNINP